MVALKRPPRSRLWGILPVMTSPAPRGRVKLEGDSLWASCRRCTWELPVDTISEGCDAAAAHLPRCGRELYLRPATFTHSGDSSHPISVPSVNPDELYRSGHGVLAVAPRSARVWG